MGFVLDASVAASWLLSDENDPRSNLAQARLQHDEAHAPDLWWYEVRNIFIVHERRGRISTQQRTDAMLQLRHLPVTLHNAPEDTLVLSLTQRQQLTVYDAAYLALAVTHHWPLATLDNALIRAARAEHVAIIGIA